MQTFESIRARLNTQASGRLNGSPSPEQKLFIEWMAWELSVLHRELDRSNDAITTRINRRLQADTATRPQPAFALAYAQPRENGVMLKPEEDILHISRPGTEGPRQIFFAPLMPVPMVKARVKYLAAGQSLAEVAEPMDSQQRYAAVAGRGFHPGVLWVGVQMEKTLPEGQPLCFYFDYKVEKETRRQELNRLLPLVSWQHGGKQVAVEIGLHYDLQAVDRHMPSYVDEEFMHLYDMERRILQHYNPHFITVRADKWDKTPVPVEIAGQFAEGELEGIIKEELVWLRLSFPAGFKPEDVQKTIMQLNCFPVLNRKLDRSRDFTPSGEGGIDIVPLSNSIKGGAALSESGLYFLGVQRIFARNTDYKPAAFAQFREAPVGYYALQHGQVEADDYRDIYARIGELSHLLRSHASTLTLLPQHTVNQALSQITDGAEMLENALRQAPPKDLDLGYFLHIKPLDTQDMIYVRFWVTQGEYATGVGAPGDLLTAEKNTALEGDRAWWVG